MNLRTSIHVASKCLNFNIRAHVRRTMNIELHSSIYDAEEGAMVNFSAVKDLSLHKICRERGEISSVL